MTFKTKQTGDKATYDTGAQRDTAEGKGRYDLIAWDAVRAVEDSYTSSGHFPGLGKTQETKIVDVITKGHFELAAICCSGAIVQNEKKQGVDLGSEDWPLYAGKLHPLTIKRLAQVYERGAKYYGDRNWEKGIPESRLIDSALRHAHQAIEQQWVPELAEEDHLGHCLWNLLAIIHFRLKGESKPEEVEVNGETNCQETVKTDCQEIQVGDTVEVVENISLSTKYKSGDRGTVKRISGTDMFVEMHKDRWEQWSSFPGQFKKVP